VLRSWELDTGAVVAAVAAVVVAVVDVVAAAAAVAVAVVAFVVVEVDVVAVVAVAVAVVELVHGKCTVHLLAPADTRSADVVDVWVLFGWYIELAESAVAGSAAVGSVAVEFAAAGSVAAGAVVAVEEKPVLTVVVVDWLGYMVHSQAYSDNCAAGPVDTHVSSG
jgi:hypothetical protein